jgi:hypothetical protein
MHLKNTFSILGLVIVGTMCLLYLSNTYGEILGLLKLIKVVLYIRKINGKKNKDPFMILEILLDLIFLF